MSDNSANSNHTVPTNVHVKVEPGTSAIVPNRPIKIEPGLLPTTTRLTSFRLPRDLTLGGNIKTEKPKKVYTPNINAQRNKKKDDPVQIKTESTRGGRDRERGRGRGRGDRGRGRGVPSNLIQSSGVFSQGISSMVTKRYDRFRDSGDRCGSTQALEKPKLNLNQTIDKAEEEEKLKSILRDDFIDDGIDVNLDNGPVLLPMISEGKLFKTELKADISAESEEEVDRKPIILENGTVLKTEKEVKVKVPPPASNQKETLPSTVPQIIENKPNSYILLQFPDCLPGLESNGDANEPKIRRPGDAPSSKESDSTSTTEYCTLNTLKSGHLGKLEILKSGKARLRLAETNLVVDVGSTFSFRQDLIAAKLDTAQLCGELINLGPVHNALICSPDWESMLAVL